MLTEEQADILRRFRRATRRLEVRDYVDHVDHIDHAFEACRILITGYCRNWETDMQAALEHARQAFDLPDGFLEQAAAAFVAEAADLEDAERRFPLSDWQRDVATGDTQLGYDDWFEHKWKSESDNNA
jgi:hypothetical protein